MGRVGLGWVANGSEAAEQCRVLHEPTCTPPAHTWRGENRKKVDPKFGLHLTVSRLDVLYVGVATRIFTGHSAFSPPGGFEGSGVTSAPRRRRRRTRIITVPGWTKQASPRRRHSIDAPDAEEIAADRWGRSTITLESTSCVCDRSSFDRTSISALFLAAGRTKDNRLRDRPHGARADHGLARVRVRPSARSRSARHGATLTKACEQLPRSAHHANTRVPRRST